MDFNFFTELFFLGGKGGKRLLEFVVIEILFVIEL